MKRNTVTLLQISAVAGLFAFASAEAALVRNPTQVGSNIDVGQVMNGWIWDEGTVQQDDEGNPLNADGQVITRTGVYLTESGVYDERLTVRVSIGGLFWFSLPEDKTFQARTIKFGPGVGQATGIYAFGADPKNPAATLQFGLFPHKYSESVNFGDYLYRSGTYPGVLYSGGWSYINSASYLAQGLRLNVPMMGGKIKHDVTLYMERGIEPTHNITPGYMITAKPVPFFEASLGGVWSHGLPLKSEKLITPKDPRNAYSKSEGRAVEGDTLGSPCADSISAGASSSDCGYYTFRGFKMAARASLDIGMLLGVGAIKPNDFKLYGEVAVLGVENQPGVYDDISERMPVMVGVNLPTFGLLDRLSAEIEYRNSPYANTTSSAFELQLPLPYDAVQGENAYNYTSPGDDDNLKWTVYAKRRIIGNVNLYAQVANDHQRHMSFKVIPSYRPFTERPSDWYYVMRLEFGI